MDEGQETILGAIENLRELTEAKFETVEAKIDANKQILKHTQADIERNRNSISTLYDLERKQNEKFEEKFGVVCEGISANRKDIEVLKKTPAAELGKRVKGMFWGGVAAVVTAVFVSIWSWIKSLITHGGP